MVAAGHHLAGERPERVMPSNQGLLTPSNDGLDGTSMSQLLSVKRDSHLEESDNICRASSLPGGIKRALKGERWIAIET